MSQNTFDPLTQELDGVHSIEASAGTGKTYTITILWLRHLIENRIAVENILVSTFTTAATAELSDRLIDSLRRAKRCAAGEEVEEGCPEAKIISAAILKDPDRDLLKELEGALSSFDLAPVSTIHGFCQSLSDRQLLELGADPDLELMANSDELLREVVTDYLSRESSMVLMSYSETLKKAKVLARESGIDREFVFPKEKREKIDEKVLEDLREILPEVQSRLPEIISKGSVDKTYRVIKGLSKAAVDEKINDKAMSKIEEKWPELFELIARSKKTIRAKMIRVNQDLIDEVRNVFADRKRSLGYRTFDDILTSLQKSLKDESTGQALLESVRKQFSAVIIDECQDSDAVQIDIFRRFFVGEGEGNETAKPTKSFMVIGDPKQSIYRFRGADLSSYSSLTACSKKAPEMKRNYRSDGPLVDSINALYEKQPIFSNGDEADASIKYIEVEANQKEVRLEDPELEGADSLLLIQSGRDDRNMAKADIAEKISQECERLLQGHVKIEDRDSGDKRVLIASDIAVLCSGHAELGEVRRHLEARGLPVQQSGKGLGDVSQSDESFDILAWLSLLSSCESRQGNHLGYLLSFMATPFMGLSALELAQLTEDAQGQMELTEDFKRESEVLKLQGPLSVLLRRMSEDNFVKRTLSHLGGERKVSNWRQLGVVLQEYWSKGSRDASSLGRVLARMMASSNDENEEKLMKLETDLPAIELSTIHSAKGLEYGVVFCPFMWLLKSKLTRKKIKTAVVRNKEGGILNIDEGSSEFLLHQQSSIRQEEDERERLLYVALTRARHRLYVGIADIPESRGHENGSRSSKIWKLLDLEGTWEGGRPYSMLHECLQSKKVMTASLSEKKIELMASPRVQGWKGLICKMASYSSLEQGEHDISPAADYDENSEVLVQKNDEGALAGLGSGAELGNLVHNILEQVLGNRKSLGEASQDEDLNTAIEKIVEAEFSLPHASNEKVSLMQLRDRSIAEMHFLMPLGECSPKKLSSVLKKDPALGHFPNRQNWAEAVGLWSFSRMRGFLQGYIDLIFEHDGYWYIVDYKTNLLKSYDEESLEEAMLHSNYLLQSRLYALALHRHLRSNLKDYSFDKNFGGCLYLFVRGFPEAGVWSDCPDREAIDALDQLFEGEL